MPKDDAGECWNVSLKSDTRRKIKISFKQIWSVARFGIHTAEEGIPDERYNADIRYLDMLLQSTLLSRISRRHIELIYHVLLGF